MSSINGELFYDDEHHAMRALVEGGRGYQKTASHLWPDMKLESAYAKLKHAVNGTNGERLSFGQVREAMLFNDRYCALYWLSDSCAHSRGQRLARKDEEARLVSVIDAASATLGRALDSLNRLKEEEARVRLKVAG